MKHFVTARDGTSTKIALEYPNKCPICNDSISPDNKMEYINNDLKMVNIMFGCPSCGKGFISHYKFDGNRLTYSHFDYSSLELLDSFPGFPEEIIFDDCIKNLSPRFCEIYNQSSNAEFYKLNEIAGMGYRKSLEFLIKDYCIHNSNENEEEIKKMPLSQVIDNYVSSEKIKKLAKVSAWIGNDETHYIKVWDNKTVDDLKKFIKSIVAFITYDVSVDEASDMINSKE